MISLVCLSLLSATPKTFRVDYFHTGNATEERFSIERLVVEPLPWPGNPSRPLDDTNSGKYRFEVRDLQTKKPIYSRGFNSIFGEFEETAEAKKGNRTFGESLRFPMPGAPVEVGVEKRDPQNAFHEVWKFSVDPKDPTIDTSLPRSPGPLIEIQKSGDPAHKVDLLILGDGYTRAQRKKFEKDARKLAEILFTQSPFKERRKDFNVWGLVPEAAEPGISRPSTGIHRRSPLGTSYDAFGSERYILTFDNDALRDAASFAPYELIEILTNTNTYGGGGIYNLYSTVAADTLWAPYIFVHEFGHHIAGLADEYFTSESAYESQPDRPEPWEPNVTALKDPKALKWKSLASPEVPIPTPWDEQGFETWEKQVQAKRKEIRAQRRPESEMDALFTQEKATETQLLHSEKYSGKVGAFEGANYESKGYYRPTLDCIMFSRDQVPFCPVCQQAIERIIDLDTAY